MPVHYAGNLGDLDALYQFAANHGLRVVEDAAHAFGSQFKGAPAGSMGDLVCFSFDPIKNITAGEGGAIVCRDEKTLLEIRKMRNLGIHPLDTNDGSYDFDVSGPGYRYQMSDLMAAIARSQLARFTTEIAPAKCEIKAAYTECLKDIDGIAMLPLEDECIPHIVPVMVDPQKRPAVQQNLADAGFETKIHYKPNHLLSAWKGRQPCPNAEYVYARVLTLPSHLGVSRAHVEAIVEILAHS
jgi:dTDP-4-amino-4,6-dideoxygalactose transaminase